MPNSLESLRTIIIPAHHTNKPEGIRIPVEPHNDSWLVNPGRTWEEVDTSLEYKLQGYQAQFQFIDEPTPMARAYGLERPIGGNIARLLGYSSLLDEYRMVKNSYTARATRIREDYEQEKRHIRAQLGTKGRANQQIDRLWKEQYNPQLNRCSERIAESERVQQLVLRKGVMDLFSVRNSTGKRQQPMIEEQFLKMLTALPQHSADMNSQREPIKYLLTSLTNYLRRTNDIGLFARYKYRNSPDIVVGRDDCKVLDAALQFMFSSGSAFPETSRQLEQLGTAFFHFLGNRAEYAHILSSDQYPYLSLIYDTLTAAFYRRKPNIISNVGKVVDVYMGEKNQHSSHIQKEFLACSNEQWRQGKSVYDHYARSTKKEVDPPPASAKEFLKSTEHRILSGLGLFVSSAGANGIALLPNMSRFDKYIIPLFQQMLTGRLRQSTRPQQLNAAMELAARQVGRIIYREGAIEIDLASELLSQVVPNIIVPNEERTKQRLLDELLDLERQMADDPRSIADIRRLQSYLSAFWQESSTPRELIDEENNYFWDEILNNADWFVSPRGDRFSIRNNDDLKDIALESITFNIDRQFPREHRVNLQIEGINNPIILWLDIDRNVRGSQRQFVSVDVAALQPFLNSILKRLYYITSGILSTDQSHPPAIDQGGNPYIYKRAHYRTLNSTDRRPITMTSHGALTHAREVFEDYGIDIFAETTRRRNIGTILPNQYLTFSREVTPAVRANLILPNDLRYDPDRIVIPDLEE